MPLAAEQPKVSVAYAFVRHGRNVEAGGFFAVTLQTLKKEIIFHPLHQKVGAIRAKSGAHQRRRVFVRPLLTECDDQLPFDRGIFCLSLYRRAIDLAALRLAPCIALGVCS